MSIYLHVDGYNTYIHTVDLYSISVPLEGKGGKYTMERGTRTTLSLIFWRGGGAGWGVFLTPVRDLAQVVRSFG